MFHVERGAWQSHRPSRGPLVPELIRHPGRSSAVPGIARLSGADVQAGRIRADGGRSLNPASPWILRPGGLAGKIRSGKARWQRARQGPGNGRLTGAKTLLRPGSRSRGRCGRPCLARLRCQRRHHSPQPHRRRRTEMGRPEMSFPRTRQGIARALRQPARRRPHPPAQSVRHAYPAPRTGRRGRPEISTVFASAAPGCSPRPSRELTGDQAWRVPPPPQPAAPRSAASSRLPSIR